MTSTVISKCAKCRRYCRLVTTFLFSHIGLCGLVVGYSLAGAFTFEALEAGYEQKKRDIMTKERTNLVLGLWSLTTSSSVLCEKNWSALATVTLQEFEMSLVKAVRKEGYDGKDESPLQWSFSGALLYSIIVITTIGYGNVAPKTSWGKIITIFYAIVGIPLLLLCLSNIGDAMAHSFKFIYWKVCCYFCVRPKKHHRKKPEAHYRTQSIRMAPKAVVNLPVSPQLSCSPDVSESPQLTSSSAYYTAQSSASPTISSCKSTPGHKALFEFGQKVPENLYGHGTRDSAQVAPSTTLTELGQNLPETRACQRNRYSHGAHDVPLVSVIANKYALQEDANFDVRPLQFVKKVGTVVPPPQDIFTIMNSRSYACGPPEVFATKNRFRWDKDHRHLYTSDNSSDNESMGYLSSDDEEVTVPMWLCFALVVSYICGGAILFTFWEKWNFLDSSYFCFVTLTTIGFGDLVPGTAVISDDNQLTLGLCSLYLLFGMALLAMSFNLVQEEVTRSVRCVAKRIGMISDDEDDYNFYHLR